MEDKITALLAKLEAKAAEWQTASEDFYEEEPDDMDSVENDAMSAVYGEAADFLRTIISEARKA